LDADPDPTFHSSHYYADPDPTFQFDTDPDPTTHVFSELDPAFHFDADPDGTLHGKGFFVPGNESSHAGKAGPEAGY
jgi:hypothetical protein